MPIGGECPFFTRGLNWSTRSPNDAHLGPTSVPGPLFNFGLGGRGLAVSLRSAFNSPWRSHVSSRKPQANNTLCAFVFVLFTFQAIPLSCCLPRFNAAYWLTLKSTLFTDLLFDYGSMDGNSSVLYNVNVGIAWRLSPL